MKIFRIEFVIFLMLLLATLIYRLYYKEKQSFSISESEVPHIVVLGIAQDAGYPQINCKKSCCINTWDNPSLKKMVSSIGIRDPKTKKAWLIDATPDIKEQLNLLLADDYTLEGIFLTHAHMGHYTGLMELGREAMSADAIPIYVMPKMKNFLETNGPWSQLVSLKNIDLKLIDDNVKIALAGDLNINAFQVPHRDEFSETVGYKIAGHEHSLIFIPDIDKWTKWNLDINEEIKQANYALLDGTFYRNGEIWGRDMSEIPHPFMEESMSLFKELDQKDQNKIYFIHLNHTNPMLDPESEEYKDFDKGAFHIAHQQQIFDL
ncbi:MBL fold metallo-hydrolase [Saprospiraceae bacterium]|nr:MBL fold metallo-hydrolase [Saprospiraceae bacterium]